MGSCFKSTLAIIGLFGVNPTAYSNLVNSTVNTTIPSNNDIGNAYSESLTNTSSYITLLVLVVVLIVFIIIIIILLIEKRISIESAIVLITACIAFVAVYYFLAKSCFFTFSKRNMLKFQEAVTSTTIYTVNSIARDILYIGLCK